MLGHDAWATGVLLEKSSALSDEQVTQAFDIGHGSVLETLTHLVNVIEYWTANMQSRPANVDWETRRTLADLLSMHNQFQGQFASAARAAQAEGRLDDLFNDSQGYPQSIGGTIVHLMYHNVIHRSEVQHMLNRLGVEPDMDGDPQEWEYGMRQMQQSS